MGFLSSIGSSVVGSAKSFVGMGNGGSGNLATDLFNVYNQFTSGTANTFTDNYSKQVGKTKDWVSSIWRYQDNMIRANAATFKWGIDSLPEEALKDFPQELHYQTSVPNFGYDVWLNEKYMWQRNLYNFFGEPGYFYYKIFFKFDTNYGLFGGILNGLSPINSQSQSSTPTVTDKKSKNALNKLKDTGKKLLDTGKQALNSFLGNSSEEEQVPTTENNMIYAHNSAIKYLQGINNNWNTSIMAAERINALVRFTRTLSYISTNAPWFFKSVKGLDKAGIPIIDDFTKERTIDIECNVDSIDMRLSTMMDWYKFACYDDMYHYEVIPENLRKFDMLIMVFPSPIKELHMPVMNLSQSVPFAHTNKSSTGKDKLSSLIDNQVNKLFKKNAETSTPEQFGNNFSFKLFEFIGCEIDRESISSQVPGDLNNENPFNLGKGNIKIKYDQCYQHTSNEFERMLFGSDGIIYDYDNKVNSQYADSLGYNIGNRIQIMMPDDLTNIEGVAKHFGGMLAEYATNNVSKFANKIMGKLLGNTWSNLTTLGYLTGNENYIPGNSDKWKESVNRLTSKFEHKDTTLPYDSKNNLTNKYSQNKDKWTASLDNLNSKHDHTNTSEPYKGDENLTVNYSKYTADMVQGLKDYVSTIFNHKDTRQPKTESGGPYPYRTFRKGSSVYEMTEQFNFGNNSLENKKMNLADYWIFKQKQFTSGHDHNNTTNIYDPTENLTVHYSQFADVWDKVLKDLNSEHDHEGTTPSYNSLENLTVHYSQFADVWDKTLKDLNSEHSHEGTTESYNSKDNLTNHYSKFSDTWDKLLGDLNSQHGHEGTTESYNSNNNLTNHYSKFADVWDKLLGDLDSQHDHPGTTPRYDSTKNLTNHYSKFADVWDKLLGDLDSKHDHPGTTPRYDSIKNLTNHYSKFADVWDKLLGDLDSQHDHPGTTPRYDSIKNLTNHYSKFADVWDKLLGDLDSQHDHPGTTPRYDSTTKLTNKVSINSDIWAKMLGDLDSQHEHDNTKEPYNSNEMLTNNVSKNKEIWKKIFDDLNSQHNHDKTEKPYKK